MFGVCYYPEHWPASQWQEDAQMMVELGLTYVRIGEFAWSKIEPMAALSAIYCLGGYRVSLQRP